MCPLAVLGSQGIVVKYTAAIFFPTVDCNSLWVTVFKHFLEIKIMIYIYEVFHAILPRLVPSHCLFVRREKIGYESELRRARILGGRLFP